MQIVSNIALITINETLIVQVVSFLIFLFIINRVMFRPLRSVMAEREKHINSIQQDIVAAGKKLETLATQIRKQESAVRREARKQVRQLEEAGNRQADEIFAATSKEIAVAGESAAKEVAAQVAEAKKYFNRESESLAMTIMERLLDRRLTP